MQEPKMEAIQTTKRIHPLMAAAAVSVILVSAAGVAAITGLLPSSHSATQAQGATAPDMAAQAAPLAAQQNTQPGTPAQPYAQPYAQPAVAAAAPAPVPMAAYEQPAPAVHHSAPAVHRSPRPVVHHQTEVAQSDSAGNAGANYEQRRAEPAPSQPNYVAIGTGAVIGGLLGNHVGSGNGRKLATVAGIIGGGIAGNEIAKRNQ
jgi:hypothetical protein